jgi:TPR repeat protein
LFYTGRGVLQDYDEAMKWWRKAANQGSADAQHFLGMMYYNGEGVPQDYTQAANWIRRAAEQGDFQAQSSLAIMYDKGQGVPQDYVQAYKWINLAAARWSAWDGRRKAIVEIRAQLAAKLTPVQLAEAQRLAREWTPK